MTSVVPRIGTVVESLVHKRRRLALKSRGDFVPTAQFLARKIVENRLRARDGSITWRRPDRADADSMIPVGPHLYDGLPGIAIFLAAVAHADAAKEAEYRSLSRQILVPWRQLLLRLVRDPERARKMRFEIGGLTGLGSFIYGLVVLGRLLGDPKLLEEARQVSRLMVDEHIYADRKLDIVSGAAGAILALLALDRHLSGATETDTDPGILASARSCARHLLAQRVDREDYTTVWETDPRYPSLTGFAHGVAGICCALLQLYQRTEDPKLFEVARRGLAFERTTFSLRHRNWIDRTSSELRFLNQWCFGAPGIALGRLLTLDALDDDRVWSEIYQGLERTADAALTKLDHVCCGGMGRVDVLLFAYESLGKKKYYYAACELARQTMERAGETRRFRGMMPSEHRDPSFFSGDAGIGYTLLRLTRPGELPCLLAMQ